MKNIKIIRAVTVSQSLGFCREIMNKMREMGYEMVAVSSPGCELDELREVDGFKTYAVSMARHISVISDVRSLFNMISVFRKERPQVVHSMTPKAGLICMLAAWLTRVPVRIHTFTGLVWPTATGLKRRILMTTDWLTCACATHIIPEGQGVMNDLRNGGITKKPMKVLGYGNVRGVDMERFNMAKAGSIEATPRFNMADASSIEADASVQGSMEGKRIPIYDSNYWLCTITIDSEVKVKGQENAYKEVVKSAVGGAAGVIHQVDSATTDCQPNDNVEAMRMWMLEKKVECRPVWKPMHRQPVYADGAESESQRRTYSDGKDFVCLEGPKMVAYVNGVSEEIFKMGMCLPAGPCVSDDDVRYIVECLKEGIMG